MKKILGDERGETEKRTDGESGVGMDPELPHGGYWETSREIR